MEDQIKIAVIGLGYVGLPLARLFATKYPVVGFDINENRINKLKQDYDETLEVDTETLKNALVNNIEVLNLNSESQKYSRGLFLTSNLDEIRACNFYIITVPT